MRVCRCATKKAHQSMFSDTVKLRCTTITFLSEFTELKSELNALRRHSGIRPTANAHWHECSEKFREVRCLSSSPLRSPSTRSTSRIRSLQAASRSRSVGVSERVFGSEDLKKTMHYFHLAGRSPHARFCGTNSLLSGHQFLFRTLMTGTCLSRKLSFPMRTRIRNTPVAEVTWCVQQSLTNLNRASYQLR